MCSKCLGSQVISIKMSFGVMVGPCTECNPKAAQALFASSPEVGDDNERRHNVSFRGPATGFWGWDTVEKIIPLQHHYNKREQAARRTLTQTLLDDAQPWNNHQANT